MIKIDKADVLRRKNTLEDCKAYLKQEFIGIDGIIDDIVDYLQVWYLMPEILNRPIILNLWGMTGVGKTDLVRKMVKFLNFQDRFIEIELSNIDSSSYTSNVSQILSSVGISDEKPAIILFDEIQRFNTLDNDGNPMPQAKFSDFWELLSDGRLSKKTRDDLDSYLFNYLSNKKGREKAIAKGEEFRASDKLTSWDARVLQSMLGLDISIEKLSDMREEDMIEIILNAKQEKKIYEPVDHSKTLIIISGNLDEAFSMASQTSEADIDADIYHAFTKKITVVDIKNALTLKFRPEQVARFGNIHLIYRSLSKKNFQDLIQKEIDRIIADTKEKVGIDLKVSKNINELIYRNGVFPVQGVRPVFSSVIDILEANLSKFMYEAIMASATKISVDYDKKTQHIRAQIGKQEVDIPYVGRIDKIRQSNQADVVANISVHEAGHAVAYMIQTGMVPLQLKSKVASSYAGGFTFPHQIHSTKGNIVKKIKIYLAGGIAEELVFGPDNASIGRSHDREEATVLAMEYIRKYGFDEDFQAVYNLEGNPFRMDLTVTDVDIEKMITRLVAETKEMLNKHTLLLRALSHALRQKGSLEAEEVLEIAQQFALDVKVQEEGHLHIFGYGERMGEE